jgi:hypothetical protein
VFTLSESFDDESEVEEADEQYVEFLEAGEDSTEALEPAEQSFDLVTFLVEGAVVFPGFDAIGLGWNHRNHAQIEYQLARLIALIGTIHQDGKAFRHPRQLPQQLASFWSIVRVARRQSERYGRSSIRGNHMHLGVPSAAAFADGLWSVFLERPCRLDGL